MIKIENDTICALSTAAGTGAIAIIRLCGKDSIKFSNTVIKCSPNLLSLDSKRLTRAKIYDDDSVLLDDILVVVFRAPNSYTGEDMVEIYCHGSDYIVGRILKIFLSKFRIAKKGEFTKRAFLNNKIDLTKAEAIGDLINSKNRYSHHSVIGQYTGKLFAEVKNILEKMTHIRVQFELEIDFLEQDLEKINLKKMRDSIEKIKKSLVELNETSEDGMILREGLLVVLVGEPNVGKSSIFNAFLQKERAIVTPYAGTTRDFLEEAISIEGFLIRLVDTAGIRDAQNYIEKLGIEKTIQQIKRAHIILNITDLENIEKVKRAENFFSAKGKILNILNKSDLMNKADIYKFKKKGYTICSTKKKDGLKSIRKELLFFLKKRKVNLDRGILTNSRHKSCVKNSIKFINKAINSIDKNLGIEFTAFDLAQASVKLEEIVGTVSTDDILNNIFNNFCIGK